MELRLVAAIVALALSGGCAVDRSGLRRVDAGEQTCAMDGGCAAQDLDGDGVPSDVDCDDGDATVRRTAERACTGACAPGVERCADGVWGPCESTDDCDCADGDMRSVDCVRCGSQSQRCVGGAWVTEGDCVGQGPCSPGDALPESEACGACGEGTRQRARICGTTCEWGPASEWSACLGELECAPADTMMESQPCGRCMSGSQLRERTCDDACAWSEWSDWSACTGEVGCLPGDEETETQACDGCVGGTRTRTRTCDAACAWGPWTDFGPCSGGTSPPCTGSDTQTEEQACGDCGNGRQTRTRSCDAATCSWNPWSDWSSCANDETCGTVFSGDYCPCSTHWFYGTCCDSGDWSGSGCSGCP